MKVAGTGNPDKEIKRPLRTEGLRQDQIIFCFSKLKVLDYQYKRIWF